MTMESLAPFLGLLGPVLGLLGLYIGSRLARNRELERARQDRIIAAYAKWLDVSALASGPRGARVAQKRGAGEGLNAEEEKFADEIHAGFSNAHANIAIYGSKEVIAALSHFYDLAPRGLTAEGRDAYVALIKAMRAESEAEDYAAFDSHVDNILVTGPERRAAAVMSRHQPSSVGVTFSPPPGEDKGG